MLGAGALGTVAVGAVASAAGVQNLGDTVSGDGSVDGRFKLTLELGEITNSYYGGLYGIGPHSTLGNGPIDGELTVTEALVAEFIASSAQVFDPGIPAYPGYIASSATTFDAQVDPLSTPLYPVTAPDTPTRQVFEPEVVEGLRVIDTVDFISSVANVNPSVVYQPLGDTKYPEFVASVAQVLTPHTAAPTGALPLYPSLISSVAATFDAQAIPKATITAGFISSVANADAWAEVVESGLDRIVFPDLVEKVSRTFPVSALVVGPPDDPTAAGWIAAQLLALDVEANNSKLARRVRSRTRRFQNGRLPLEDRVEAELMTVREDA